MAPDLTGPVREFISGCDWRGLFMVEMLRDTAGRPWFMELNGRTWGSMALARRRGLSYPSWAVQAALDPEFAPPYPGMAEVQAPHVTARHLGREVVHLGMVLARGGAPRFASSDQVADMIADPRVRGVSLTGSEAAGASVAETAGRNLKKAVLELGGSDPFIVLDTDNVEKMAETAAKARLSNAGQACNSPKRLIVPDKYFDDFVAGVTKAFETAKVGDPSDPDTVVGPLSSVDARDNVVEQVQKAVSQGATLHTGGEALAGDGAFMSPAVLTGITKDMDAYSEEIFGPVAMVYRVSSEDEAVKLANDVDFGLSGSVWGSDVDKARDVADRLDVGMAYVNEHGTTLPGLPFGGVKRSGFGRELGRWGMGEFVNTRLRRSSSR